MKDTQIKKLIESEKRRQKSVINLIASENYVSKDVLEVLGSELTNKYAEGYSGHRYYGGNEFSVKNAFRILLSDSAVKAVLINIFGGILRCDVLAAGVVNAARELGISLPVVIRMEGTNVEEGKKIIRESGFNFLVAEGMKDAAEKVVRAAQ